MDISEKIKTLPQLPGVYRFLNQHNEIIYIGKSKNLRNRVRSYFTGVKVGKIQRLVRQITDLQIQVCDTHLEARLLECQQIKEVKPAYNSQFKRERGFVYLKIGQNSRQASLSVDTDPSQGLGPFRNRQLLDQVLADFCKLYPLWIEFDGTDPDGLKKPAALEKPNRSNPVESLKGIDQPKSHANRIRFTYSVLPKRLQPVEYDQTRDGLDRIFHDEPTWQSFLDELDRAMVNAAQTEGFLEAIFFRDFKVHLQLLHRFWVEDQALFKQLIFLWVPMDQGVKYFRIQHGCIEDHAVSKEFTKSGFEEFCRYSRARLISPWETMAERSKLDFRDILYSEIRTLPQDQVVLTDFKID